MNFLKVSLWLALLTGLASAQNTLLTLPSPGSTLTAGSDVIVQVGMGGYPENIDVVAIVVGLAPCNAGGCYPPSELMGDILYQGPYQPEGYLTSGNFNQYENYTVTIPENFPAGTASLNIINFFMVGASYEPVMQFVNETVTVVS